MAREEWRRGGGQAAERLLRRAAGRDDTARSNLLLGDFLIETSFPEEAEKIFLSLLEGRPDNPDYLVRFARSLISQERFAPACHAIDRALEQNPLHADALSLLVEVSGKMRTRCRTVRRLEHLISSIPETPEPYIALATLYEKGNLPKEAEKVLQRGLERCPGNPVLLNRLGIILFRTGRSAASVRCHENALEAIDPGFTEQDRQICRNIKINLANALCKTGRVARSLDIYARLNDETPNDETVGINMAITLRQSGRRGEARRILEGLLHSNGECSHLLYWLGITTTEEGDFHTAERHFRKALALDSGNEEENTCLKMNLANVLISLGRPEEALAITEDVLFLNSGNEEARLLKAGILVSLNRFGEASGIYRALLERKNDDPPLLHRLGMIEALAGRFDEAARLLKRSFALAPRCRREECLETAEVLLLDGREADCLETLHEGFTKGTLTAGDIHAWPGLDDIKGRARYRKMTSGSLFDFADPWGGATEQRLTALASGLSSSSAEDRKECALWRELHSQGTLVGDLQAIVRHILKTLSNDITEARSTSRLHENPRVHFETHPFQGGIEIRSVIHGRGNGAGACTFSQLLFRTADGTFQLRFHER